MNYIEFWEQLAASDLSVEAKRKITQMADLLDEIDFEDRFGTEGWKHYISFEVMT